MITISKLDISTLANYHNILQREALLLLADILKSTYSKLFFEKSIQLSGDDLETFKSYLIRRENGEPISKIIQKKEFYGIFYKTTRDTLDPRPETELIVDLFRKNYINENEKLNILDLGAGTGCVGLSILKYYQNAKCSFIDISENALYIAKENAKILNLSQRCDFKISDWFQNITETYDVIVSNPPYISKNYDLEKEVLYDPELALFAENEGMAAYQTIIPTASKFLKSNGLLIIEIGFDQFQKIQEIQTDLTLLKIEKDLSGIYRTCVFQKKF